MNFLRKLGIVLLVAINIIVALGLFCSAYAGYIPPADCRGYSGVVQMTFSIWLVATAALTIFDLLLHSRTVWIMLLAILSTGGSILDYFPLNIPHGKLSQEQKERSFTLLSYNVQNFWVEPGARTNNGENATVKFILDTDADIVCLQEGKYLDLADPTPITPAQRRALHRRYPYVLMSSISQVILSKYPVKPLRLDFNGNNHDSGLIAAYRLTIEGHNVTIFNVHLQSIGLNRADKRLYRDLTNLKADNPRSVQTQLISKLAAANRRRQEQVDNLVRYIRHLGGPDVIVCGDFNDVPGSYAIRTLSDQGLRQVYPQVGFGPMITYYFNRFYFRIDHVLYRGDFSPVSMRRPRVHMSDHYPLLTTFVFND